MRSVREDEECESVARASAHRLVIYLCARAFATIRYEALTSRLETGGVLLGYETSEGIVIVRATGPGPRAKHGRYRVELDLAYIREATAAAKDRKSVV